MDKKIWQFGISNLSFTTSPDHVNKMSWQGIVAFVDKPTNGAPGGAYGYKAIFGKAEMEAKYKTLEGMGVNCDWPDGYWSSPEDALADHDKRFKIGYISEVWLEDDKVMAKGFIWKKDFYDVTTMLINGKDALGFSVEASIYDYEIQEGNEELIYIKDFVFTGVAVLWKTKAAFNDTQLLELIAKRTNRKDDNLMNEEQMKALLESVMSGVQTSITEAVAGVKTELTASLEKMSSVVDEVKSDMEAMKEASSESKAVLDVEAKAEDKVDKTVTEVTASVDKDAPVVPDRRSMQFTTVSKYASSDDKITEISANKALSPKDRIAAKVKALEAEFGIKY